jgi:23S rRNA pseudouridine1911/1915/1917 synthase
LIISAPPQDPAELAQEDLDPAGQVELRQVQVPPELQGQRLDRALAQLVPEFSRSYLQQLIEQGAVSLDGRVAGKASAKVRWGSALGVEMRETPQSQAFVPEPMPIDTVYEDPHLRVIHKPAGLVVHPAPGHWRGTLLNGVLALDPASVNLPRAGIVHRLDKDTSGLMVLARTRQTMDALVGMIAAREVQRQYLALAQGPWRHADSVEVEQAIGRDPANRLRMAVVDLQRQAGKTARTTVHLLDQTTQACLVRCHLHTGRTHQIRVHMAWLGHPLLADALYGGVAQAGLTRQALHAWRLAFVHPVTGESLVFHAPLPDDMRKALAALGLGYNPDEH